MNKLINKILDNYSNNSKLNNDFIEMLDFNLEPNLLF